MVKLRIFRWLVVLSLFATSHSVAQANCRQTLAFSLDVPGSVDAEEYQLQLKGLAAELGIPDGTSRVLTMAKFPLQILVFEWSGQNYQRILKPWTNILNIEILKRPSSKLRHIQRQYSPPTTALGKATRAQLHMQSICQKKLVILQSMPWSLVSIQPNYCHMRDYL